MPDVLTRPGAAVTTAPAGAPVLVRCDLTELFTTDCAHCRGIPDPPQPGKWYIAERAARCTFCGDPYEAGERIRSDGTRGYLGLCCGDEDW